MTRPASESARSRAPTVAAGILSSRVAGLLREAVVTALLGLGVHADALQAAFKAPNFLQNLLGEGTISAAFIPVYSRLLEECRAEDAGRFAGAVFSLLVVLVSGLVVAGILLSRPLVSVMLFKWTQDAALVAAGELSVDRLALTIDLVRIAFPMTGMLVLSAWALGILNSHRRFFVPYFAPVLWNLAIISALLVTAQLVRGGLAVGDIGAFTEVLFAAFVGGFIGGILQFCVQLPLVFHVMKGFRLSLSTRVKGVKEAIAAFGPALAGRGISQLSAYVDMLLASFLAAGALSALRPALVLYLLPISLFGLSVAAAELPELARMDKGAVRPFLSRLRVSVRQSMFFTLPTAAGYLSVGFLIVGAWLRRGNFGLEDNYLVWAVLCAYSLGLVATTISRLLQNAFWALGDTRTPARIAAIRVSVSTVAAVPLMLWFDRWAVAEVVGLVPGSEPLKFGVVGLGLASTVAAWVELRYLSARLRRRVAGLTLPWRPILRMAGVALIAAGSGLALWRILPDWPVLLQAVATVGLFATVYLGCAKVLRFKELTVWAGRNPFRWGRRQADR